MSGNFICDNCCNYFKPQLAYILVPEIVDEEDDNIYHFCCKECFEIFIINNNLKYIE